MNLLLISLLQIEPSATLWTRLGDQLFTIVLLVTIAYILWQRITKVQDKLDTYLNEDRAQMLEVIQNNTKVIEEFLKKIQS
jgi:hypothetical protein